MTLDRYITITHTPPGRRNMYGEFVAGTPVFHPAWAALKPEGSEDEPEVGGVRGVTKRSWRVRWQPGIVGVNVALLTITDGERIDANGDSVPWVFSCEKVAEFVGKYGEYRHRFLDLEGLFST